MSNTNIINYITTFTKEERLITMRNWVLFLAGWLMLSASSVAQDTKTYYLEIDPDQQVEILNGAAGRSVSVPVMSGIVVLDGTYNKEGLGQSIVFNGSRLSIDSMSMGLDGWRYLVLRRADGRDFYDMFPTIRARMIPSTQREYVDKSFRKDSIKPKE